MISKCPKCRKTVSIPCGVDSSAAVRCPLCSAEYALSEALALAPPELIPVVSTAAPPEAAAEPAPPAIAVTTVPAEAETPQDSEPENEAAAVAERFPTMPVARRRRKPKSALQTVIEVIAGGLAGCLVAYYGLAFYYGPEFAAKGLPRLPLPGIDWITAPRPETDEGKEKTPEKKPAKNKSMTTNHRSRTQEALALAGKTSYSWGRRCAAPEQVSFRLSFAPEPLS
jgi:hypothetical protein